MANNDLMYFHHRGGFDADTFYSTKALTNFYNVMSTNRDDTGR